MIATSPTSPLPTLPREDRHRLSLFFNCGEDLAALAAALNKDLNAKAAELAETSPQYPAPSTQHQCPALASSDSGPRTKDSGPSPSQSSALSPHPSEDLDEFTLQSWATQPDIAAHIDYRRREAEHRARKNALDHLEQVLKETKDLIEKRRAASAVLRTLNRTGAAPTRPSGSPPRATDRGFERSVPTTSQQSLAPESSPAPQSHESHGSHPDPIDLADDTDDDTDDDDDPETEDDTGPEDPSSPLDASMPRGVASMPSSSALSTQSSALPRRHPLPQLPRTLEPLELPSTPELDQARGRFFAFGFGVVQTPRTSPGPHPGFAPGRVLARLLSAIQNARRDPNHLITVFNHTGIADRSLHSFDCFVENLRAAYPQAFRSTDLIPVSHKQTSDHTFTAIVSVRLPNHTLHPLTFNLRRLTEGPLARCWLLKPPDTS